MNKIALRVSWGAVLLPTPMERLGLWVGLRIATQTMHLIRLHIQGSNDPLLSDVSFMLDSLINFDVEYIFRQANSFAV